MYSHELGEMAIKCGIFPLYEVEDGKLTPTVRSSTCWWKAGPNGCPCASI